MNKQRKINEFVKIKANTQNNIEYEAILNIWRASLLFFEKELRKLKDRRTIGEGTFKELIENFDFTELSRMKFTTTEPVKVVKIEDVTRVVREISDDSLVEQVASRPIGAVPSFPFPPEEKHSIPASQDAKSKMLDDSPQKADAPKRDTASAVLELRKLMLENLKRFKTQSQEQR